MTCKCSFLEIYNEAITDLLGSSSAGPQATLNLREDTVQGIYVEGLTEESVSTGAPALAPYPKGVCGQSW